MSGPGAMHGEMPGFFPGRPGGGDHDEPLLDMILDRRPLPPGAPPEMHVLARTLASAAGPADPRELAGEAAALAAFRRSASRVGVSPAARPARRWLSRRPVRGRIPLAAALVAAAAGLGSIVAGYAGVLPGPIQEMVHVTVGAPSASRDGSPQTGTPSSLPRSSPHPSGSPGYRQASSASPTPAPSQTSHRQTHRGGSGPGPEHAVPTCTPGPEPTRNPVKTGPTQYPTPGQSSWTPRPSPAGGCPVIVPQTPVPPGH
jgi:hypothetical protein